MLQLLALHSHTAELLTATVHSRLSLLDSSLPSSTLETLLFNVRLLLVFWGVTHAHIQKVMKQSYSTGLVVIRTDSKLSKNIKFM